MIKKTIAKIAAAAVAAAAATALAAAPAQAAQVNDSLVFVGPDIQQSNLYYSGPTVNSTYPGSATAPLYGVGWSYSFNNTQPAGTTLQADLCAVGYGCVDASSASGNTTAFNGKPGNTKFYLRYRLNAPSTYVFKPTAYWGARDYIYPRFTTP